MIRTALAFVAGVTVGWFAREVNDRRDAREAFEMRRLDELLGWEQAQQRLGNKHGRESD